MNTLATWALWGLAAITAVAGIALAIHRVRHSIRRANRTLAASRADIAHFKPEDSTP